MSSQLGLLNRADGSASYSSNGVSVVGSVNGPIEVLRRDELAEEATIEVIIRPLIGVGGVRERHLESVVLATLKDIVVTEAHPRTLIQIVLQVIESNEHDNAGAKYKGNYSALELLPCLLQAALLALTSASIPLSNTVVSTLISQNNSGLHSNSDRDVLRTASALHVFAFNTKRELLLSQSEGTFSLTQWQDAVDLAQIACFGSAGPDGSRMDTDGDDVVTLEQSIRSRIESDLVQKYSWKSQS